MAKPAMGISREWKKNEVVHKTLALAEECSLWQHVAELQFSLSRN